MQKMRWLSAAFTISLLVAPAGAQAPTDYSKVDIKTTKLGPNFYVLEGSGGAIGVLTGPDGVLMVDSQFAPLTDKIVAAIKQVSDRPIRFMINTHVHPDHTGGNENLAKMGVTILSRDELRARLATGTNGRGAPPAALPMITYRGQLTFHMNGEDVQAIPVPVAHTDGDTMVRFPGVDVLMTGDFYRSVGYPNIDRANGGTLLGLVAGLNAVISASGPNTKIVPGHGAIVNKTDVAAHRDMIFAIRDRVQSLIAQGKTQDEVIAAKPASSFNARVPQVGTTDDRFIGQLYAELKPAAPAGATQAPPPPPPMSFFVTSAGSGNGANLGGLAGADRQCQMLATAVGAGSKTWHAYLSTSAANGQAGGNARDRIGAGPWYNAKGARIAQNVADLQGDTLEAARRGNNLGKQTALTEHGEPVNGVGDNPNRHDMLTGSQLDGTAFTDGADHTCGNWTSGTTGTAQLGHSDRNGGGNTSWNSAHPSRGCSQDNLVSTGGAGLFYCFAIQ
jgi:cyclase